MGDKILTPLGEASLQWFEIIFFFFFWAYTEIQFLESDIAFFSAQFYYFIKNVYNIKM